ncbi:MAG: hypothetical protein EXR27_03300 [Betaproteobacteria bacterium]|nr:hypothetical protein [Betaproteobacteria bacterium]
MSNFDLTIRNATIYDGEGGPGFSADVAVKSGRIAAVGPRLAGSSAQSIDAAGLALAPGIIDTHTHYDAQITWDRLASPSPALGVTTVVMGNCGFGIAPCAPAHRELMMENLAVVEGMDLNVLRKGMRWEFESFAGYLAQIERNGCYPNVAVFAGHTPIRLAVMGEDAATRAATDAEIAAMQALVGEAMAAGAIGFATSMSRNHSGARGLPVPSRLADEREMAALGEALRQSGRGVWGTVGQQQTNSDFARIAKATGRPVVFNAALYMSTHAGKALEYLDGGSTARAEGLEVVPLVSDLPLALEFTLDNAFPFYSNPAWDPLRNVSREALKQGFADPAFRRRFVAALEQPTPNMPFQGDWRELELSRPGSARYAEFDGMRLDAIAARMGCAPVDALFDIALAEDLATLFTSYSTNGDEDEVAKLLRHDAGLVSASDAGAHIDFMCNAGFGLHLLGHWVRTRHIYDLGEAVRRLTSVPADLFRIPGRGRIAPGAHADLMLFDPDTVAVAPKRRAADLPGGGTRVICDPVGLAGVWVNGVQVFDGNNYVEHASAPGRVLREFAA